MQLLIKCKCGRYTQNGFLCTNCQRDTSIDTSYYQPEGIDEDEDLDELGFTIVDDLLDPEDEEEED